MWRLVCTQGRHIWQYLNGSDAKDSKDTKQVAVSAEACTFDSKVNVNSADKLYRLQALTESKFNPKDVPSFPLRSSDSLAKDANSAAAKAMNFYSHLQYDDGHWPGDYGGPMFLIPGMVIVSHLTDTPFAPVKAALMIKYLRNQQHQQDGGWGIHIEEKSTMFGTVINYVAMRLLGVDKEDPALVKARKFIHQHGGAMYTPSWGKFWLSVLGVMEWECNNSLFPELWLMPEFLPIHPSKMWCHSRLVYLPMAYLYGVKFKPSAHLMKPDGLIMQLRSELYTTPYDKIKWGSFRSKVAAIDVYTPHHWFLNVANFGLNVYEKLHLSYLRKRALDFIISYVHAEDVQTNYICIGPVSKFINMLCIWVADGRKNDSPRFQKHLSRVDDYLWLAEDGLKCAGYNGSQLWDCGFAVQAFTEHPDCTTVPRFRETLAKAYKYVECAQVREDPVDMKKFYRHPTRGSWPFSTREQGWPTADCTAEGLKAAIAIHHTGVLDGKHAIDEKRLTEAVDVLLGYQNKDGGWATYECIRGPKWLEVLNPSEVFGGIMIDYSYPECTSASMMAMLKFAKDYPNIRANEIKASVKRGIEYMRKTQRPDGSWYGSWAVCFTYAIWFGIEAMVGVGLGDGPEVKKACAFLVSKQNHDGGWGEKYTACLVKQYVQHEKSQVINTAWACMALMCANYPDKSVVERGIKLIISRQQESGDWDQEAISGVFNGNCMITYTSYRNVFPIWAINRYIRTYCQK